ncbi:MAG: radical SAM protein [Acidobacteria bacterium]|nr:MAG: radical SAM protein [Acidobacteriota bacterium]
MTNPVQNVQVKLLQHADRNSIPLEMSIELTHHCNFRCQHCYIPDFSAPDLLTTERVCSLLDELAEMGTLYLTLTGGEMLLRKDWYEIACYARNLGFSLRLFSNGSTITKDVADKIKSLYAIAEVSLYSMDEEIFEKITQHKGSFKKTIRGIELLREREIELLLKVPLMVFNAEGFEKVFEYGRAIGATVHADPRIIAKKDGDLSTLKLNAGTEALLPYYRSGHTPCSVDESGADDPRFDGPLCAAGNRYANITSSGDVRACNLLVPVAGNVREQSFREIWEESEWLKQIRSIRRKDLHTCDTCPKISYCGRCYAQAHLEDGDMMGPSSSACSFAEVVELIQIENGAASA